MGKADLEARRRVLDAGALVALEHGDRRARGHAEEHGARVIIPAPVLAQVWRDGARQARLAALVKRTNTTVEAFDEHVAKAAGVLLGRTGTSDVADASVVLAARLHEALVVTTDADDIRRLDPELPLAEL
ncbi:MAG: PIN domain-containing protein [Chloroflexi bacterium]|nr:PIN domain-containing protein [Chloroflexota bacterium]